MNNIVQKQKKHLTGKLLALLMFLFAFTGVTRANVQQNRADQVIEQGFEDGLGDWTLNHCHPSSGVSSSSTPHSGSNVFRFFYTSNYPQYLISPEFDEENGGGNITFYAAIFNGSYPETYKVGYSFTTNDPSEFTWYDEVTCTTVYSTGYDEVSYNLPAGVKFVSIACTSNDMFYLFVDDITVTLEEPAPAPTPGEIVEVTIGDPTAITTNAYLPTCSLYEKSITQQIYTADEIGVAGTINTFTMWLKNSSSYARYLNVYMKEIDETEFASTSAWVSMSDSDLVGSFTLANGVSDPTETAIELTTPFEYTGAGNLVLCLQDVTGSWGNGAAGVVMDAAGIQAIYAYRDGTSYDVSNPGVNGTLFAKKNVVRLAIMTGGVAGQLTVNDGTADNSHIPFYGLYADTQGSASECIISATDLADMAGGVISKMTFYLKTPAASSWTATWQVYLAEVDGTTLTGIVGPSAGTVVFEGALAATSTEMTITFDTPYTYNGGNLLIGSYVKSAGNYKSASFLGVATDGATAFYRAGSASYQQGSQSFLPKTTFDYFSTGGGTITATPSVLDLGDCPNGYSNEPATFELSTSGLDILTVTSMEVDNDYFQLDVEAPFTVSKNNPVTVNVTTGSGEPGVQNGQVTITYGESETVTVELTANVYDVVSPDIWQLAEEVTEFPFHTVTETDNLYHNYNIPGGSAEGKDAVYKVTFTEDVLLSAGNNGDNAATMIYPEDFNGEVGPGLDNYYYYDGPQVNPGPVNLWFSYDYTGTNTYFGSNANNGVYAGYKIPAAKIDELGLADCSFVAVETAAYESYPYDLYIFRGGNTPFDGELIYSKLMDHNPVARNFFDVYIDEPFLVGTEDLWVIFYSESRYMMYCGENPGDTENGKIWYTTDMSTWYSSTNYTPMIYCQFLEIPTGRTVNMNLANMEIKSNPNAAAGEVGEMAGVANGVSKAQHYMEAMAQNRRSSRDMQTLTVYEGTTTSGYVPIYGYYADDYLRAQYVMADDQLTGMIGGTISSMKFYLSSSDCTLDGTFSVYMGTYGSILIDGFVSPEEFSTVYTGNVSVSDGEMVIDFTDPFVYNGGNLLIGFDQTVVSSGYATTTFLGTTVNGASVQGYSYSSLEAVPANQRNFIPQTTFTYEIGEPTPPQPQGPVYQISEMYVPAGTYYIVTSSTTENFEFDMAVADMPAPVQAEVITPYENETDVKAPYYAQWVLGYYTKEMQVLYGTTNPPTTALIDWTDYLVESAFIPSLDNNRNYYFQVNERNEKGETEGEIIAFTTKIEPVTGFAAVSPYIYVGDVAELTWDAIQDEEFLGYNIYSENGKLNDELITDTSYLIEGLEYNPTGYYFYVNAVYEAGASALRSTQVYVSGYGVVDGHVYEQDGETPIAGVNVYFYGYDDFGVNRTFNAVTDEEGHYNIDLMSGVYETYWTVKSGYQSVYNNEIINLAYQATVEGVDFILDEMFYGVDYVEATEELPAPKVLWSYSGQEGDRSFQNYRVYRTTFDNEGPFNVNNTVFIAEVVNDTVIYDETFAELEDGLYKYGVSCVYEGNRDGGLNEFTETFDEGLPETWSMIDADGDGRCWMLGSQASLGYGHGHNGSNDMMISKSFENGSSVYPDNYLVSPLVQFGNQSRFEFYACAQDANYPEYVGVAVSTSGNEYAYDFATIAEWQVDNERAQGIWHKYIVELDQYAGQTGYIAIRHFNSLRNLYLDIDDASFYNVDIQLPRESAIRWSNMIGKGMYLTDGAVDITVELASGDAPEGITATFKNLTQSEYEDIVVELDENGYYSFDSFRKGYYKVILGKAGYENLEDYVEIWEPVSLEFLMHEELKSPTNFTVSSSGYASWQAPQANGRHFVNRYYLSIYDESGSYIYGEETTDNFVYLNEDNFSDGVMYQANVVAYYSTQDESTVYSSDPAICYWTYRSCDHYLGANNLTVKPLEEGVYMTWEYPVVDTVQVLGANVYVNNEYFGFTEGDEWMFEGYNEYNTFSLRLVYEGNRLSCMQDAYLLKKYWIESFVNNGEGGSVTESAYYFEGDTCVLTATPSEDYDFYCWYNNYTGQVASYEPTFSFVVRGYGSYGASFITDYYWNDVNLYENNMNVIGLIKVDDEIFDANEYTPLYEIGAFCGDECRGHQRLHYYPEVDRYLVYLTINGNEGDNINFLISYLGVEQNYMCTSPIVFEADAALGTSFEPYELTFYRSQKIEQYDEFNTGWNWWSTYIEQDNMFNGLQSLQTDLASTGYMISSQTAYTMNYGAYGWYGSLNKINNESMYKIKMNEPGYSDLYYYNARTDLHPITVVPGWNYIGYAAHFWMSLDEALIGLKPSNGDMIKSQYEYANYYEGYGWFGSLNYLNPGMGYMYKSTSADTLTFVYGQDTSADTLYRQETGILTVEKRIRENNNHWVSNANAYRDNMTVMAVVNLDGVELSSDNYELAAFVDGECRGSVRLTYAEPLNRYVAFLTVAGEETATLSFGLYDAATGAECYSDDNFEFNSDIMVGNPGNPVVISFNGMGDSGFKVYPNPVAKGECVNIVLPNGSKRVQVEVVNSLGEVVSVETLTQSQASIALPEVPGVYTVRIITDNKDTNFKKVIVK